MNTATNYDLKIKKRIQLVHIAANELGLLDPKQHATDPDDDYHRVLARWNRQGTRQPVTSSKQMTHDQLGELLAFFKGLGFKIRGGDGNVRRRLGHSKPEWTVMAHNSRTWQKYDSSIQGLKDEICDLAKARFGAGPPDDTWERPLNSLCNRFGVRHWKWLDVAHGKEVKNVILRMNANDKNRSSADVAEKDDCPF